MASSKSVPNKSKVNSSNIPKVFVCNRKIKILKGSGNILQTLKVQQLFTEDVIYESKEGDFLNSDECICIVNRRDITTNVSRTIVRSVARPNEVLKTSDDIVKLIGQENYDLLFSALCSVLSLELKVRGILALLTAGKLTKNITQNENTKEIPKKEYKDTMCQTDQNCMDIFIRQNRKRRVRRQPVMPYVVTDKPVVKSVKKMVIHPENFKIYEDNPVKRIIIQPHEFHEFQNDSIEVDDGGGSTLPTLSIHDENSNASIGNMSSFSIITLPHLLEDPVELLNNIQSRTEHTDQTSSLNYQPTTLTMLDGCQVTIPVKPEDDLHIATSDILKSVPPELHTKVKMLQAYYDWKYCLVRDEDGNLPLHIAVNTGDMELLKRQCLVLKLRHESVDVLAGSMTALQMSLYQKNTAATAILLQSGADLLKKDSENRTCVHLAAEEASDHLATIVKHCRDDPLTILRENEEFWKPGIESMTKQEQACYLLDKIARLTDNQGYTPLMVASKLGISENVAILLDMAPTTVDYQMPNSGNTALYLAVSAACIDASNRGNFQKVGENYLKIVAKLCETGANPSLENHAGHNVHLLLQDFNVADLSNVIASKMIAAHCYREKIETSKGFENVMFLKDKDGSLQVKDIKVENIKSENIKVENNKVENNKVENNKVENNKVENNKVENNKVENIKVENVKVENNKSKPVILENVRVNAKIDNQKLIVSKFDQSKIQGDNFVKDYISTNIEKRTVKILTKNDSVDFNRKMVIKNDYSRVRKAKTVADVKPAKIMKVTPDTSRKID